MIRTLYQVKSTLTHGQFSETYLIDMFLVVMWWLVVGGRRVLGVGRGGRVCMEVVGGQDVIVGVMQYPGDGGSRLPSRRRQHQQQDQLSVVPGVGNMYSTDKINKWM